MGGIGVGEGGGAVGSTVGIAVAGTGIGVEPEQAANSVKNRARNSAKKCIEAQQRLRCFDRRLKMLTSILRNLVCCRMFPLARWIGPTGGQSRVYHWSVVS